VANKTGTGDYGTLNDVAIVWQPELAPIAIAIMSSKDAMDAQYDESLIAEVAEYVVAVIA
jgi:beta-lactamase class A